MAHTVKCLYCMKHFSSDGAMHLCYGQIRDPYEPRIEPDIWDAFRPIAMPTVKVRDLAREQARREMSTVREGMDRLGMLEALSDEYVRAGA